MKKILNLAIIFSLVFFGMAYAADVVVQNPNGANYLDTFYKMAITFLITALAGILASIIPIIMRKGNDLTDSFWLYLKNLAKKVENDRIQARLDKFIDILDTAADRVWEAGGKAQAKYVDGKIVVINLEDIKNEIKTNVTPQLTNSTKDMAKELGMDIEEMIKQKIVERAKVVL